MGWFLAGLRHEAIRLVKKNKQIQKHELLILNARLKGDDEDEETEMIDNIADTRDTFMEVENLIFLQEILSLLTPKQQKVIKATILDGYTEKEVSADLGISQSAVHHIKERALKRLKKHFATDKPIPK
ncbi:sigma-70 family RNA polymerase sigma factor [Thermoanaerobacter mathranii]|uniref:sigma-70 family RNA polymerase sigma factor n=1 Tax=Thermoanaerobacter mathranii TaxID=583357 RepID=UPI003D6BDB09